MKQFEYKTMKWIFENRIAFWDNQNKEEMNYLESMGKLGWELTSIIFSKEKRTKIYYFKKEITTI